MATSSGKTRSETPAKTANHDPMLFPPRGAEIDDLVVHKWTHLEENVDLDMVLRFGPDYWTWKKEPKIHFVKSDEEAMKYARTGRAIVMGIAHGEGDEHKKPGPVTGLAADVLRSKLKTAEKKLAEQIRAVLANPNWKGGRLPGVCSADLMARHLGVDTLPEMERILAYANRSDTKDGQKDYELARVLKRLNRFAPGKPEERWVDNWELMRDVLDAEYAEQQQFHYDCPQNFAECGNVVTVERKIGKAVVKTYVAIVESDLPMMSPWARCLGLAFYEAREQGLSVEDAATAARKKSAEAKFAKKKGELWRGDRSREQNEAMQQKMKCGVDIVLMVSSPKDGAEKHQRFAAFGGGGSERYMNVIGRGLLEIELERKNTPPGEIEKFLQEYKEAQESGNLGFPLPGAENIYRLANMFLGGGSESHTDMEEVSLTLEDGFDVSRGAINEVHDEMEAAYDTEQQRREEVRQRRLSQEDLE